jgi:hypothetical protein
VNVRRSIAATAILLAAPMLASCGFSQQTDQVYNAAAGVDNRSGSVYVLNALIVSGSNGSGTVVASLVNTDEQNNDALTGVTGDGLTVNGPTRTTVPAGGNVNLSDLGKYSASGQAVVPGKFVKLTFTFQRAQQVTLDVPVMSSSNPDYSGVPLPKS